MRFVTRLGLSSAIVIAAFSAASAQVVIVRPIPLPTPSSISRSFELSRRYDGEALAAGLVPLREARLGPGEREVRIWTKVELSGTVQLHRFTERDGRVRGEMVYAWHAGPPDASLGERTGETYHDHMLYRLRGACEGFAVAFERGACRARFRREPPWNRVLREAEANGVWTLVDQDSLPHTGFRIILDGWSMVVELRDGASYRAYRYHCPWAHPEWRSATLATAIARSLHAIDSLMTRPDVRRVYRGSRRADTGRLSIRAPAATRGSSITSFGGCSSTHRRPCGRALHRRRSTRPRARNRCSTRLRCWASSIRMARTLASR